MGVAIARIWLCLINQQPNKDALHTHKTSELLDQNSVVF